MNQLFKVFAVAGLAMVAGIATAAGNAEAGQEKAAICVACHGADGNSPALPPPTEQWPKLAGQMPVYFVKQLHDFKAGHRNNEQMSPMAQTVADVDIEDIAAYFAQQKVTSEVVADANLLARGEKLYLKGTNTPPIVTACIGCHAPNGVGQIDWVNTYKQAPVVLAPAIGGQHASYLAKQLQMFRSGERNNDIGQVMRNIAARLSDSDIEALAAYISTLGN